jgi:hypothetical protein
MDDGSAEEETCLDSGTTQRKSETRAEALWSGQSKISREDREESWEKYGTTVPAGGEDTGLGAKSGSTVCLRMGEVRDHRRGEEDDGTWIKGGTTLRKEDVGADARASK